MSAFPAGPTTTARIEIGEFGAVGAANTAAGLATPTDRDWIAIDLVAGHNYRFEGALSGAGAAISLNVVDATGAVLGAATQISGSGNAALLLTGITTSGTYYIDVGSANGVIGSYDVTVIDTTIRPITDIVTLTAGDDTLTSYDQELTRGLEGDDVINADDVLLGQQGRDTLTARGIGYLLYGGDGDDRLQTTYSTVYIDGGRGHDTFVSLGVQLDVDLDWIKNGAIQTGPRLVNVENVQGSIHDDIINGTDTGNQLVGGDGNDTINGRGARDLLMGGAGMDVIDGGDGNDEISGDDGDDTILGGDGDDLLRGGPGDDVLRGGEGSDFLVGGAGADLILGGTGMEDVPYWLRGVDEVSYLLSDAGVTVDLRGYEDEHGLHIYSVGQGGHAEGDRLADVQNLVGSAFDDVITASARVDSIITPGAGADRVTGYSDVYINTFVSYTTTTVDLFIDVVHDIFQGGEADGDVLVNITGIIGGSGNDTITIEDVTTGEIANFRGGAGDDTLIGGKNRDTLNGQAGADELYGNDGADYIYTNEEGLDFLDGGDNPNDNLVTGIDLLIYETDQDVIFNISDSTDNFGNTYINFEGVRTGDGNDLVTIDAPVRLVETGAGDDWIVYQPGIYCIVDGGEGYDTWDTSSITADSNGQPFYFYASSTTDATFRGIESLFMGSGDNYVIVISPRATIPSIYGRDGNDRLVASTFGSRLDGGNGDDTLTSNFFPDILLGGSGTDEVTYLKSTAGVVVELISGVTTASGGYARGDVLASIENLTGSAHNDRLHGGDENNVFVGLDGDDILLGRGGTDTLTGGDGADRFVYSATSQSIGATRDTITDFNRSDGDSIDMLNIDADTVTAGNQAFSFIGTAAFTGAAGELRATQVDDDTLIEADNDGDGIADLDILVLANLAAGFVAADFVL